jgi:heme/copper-type cytochrome/quinol oxidase subunit 2
MLRLGVARRPIPITDRTQGETATVEYVAEKPGTVEFKCCSFCGFGHGKMKGKIVIH